MDPQDLDAQAQAADDERRRFEAEADQRRSQLNAEASDLAAEASDLRGQADAKDREAAEKRSLARTSSPLF